MPLPLTDLEEAIHERFLDAVPELFLASITKVLSRPDDEVMRLVMVYQVMIAKYVRAKILLKRRQSNYDRWSGIFVHTKPPPVVKLKVHDFGKRRWVPDDIESRMRPFTPDNIGPRGQTETAYEALYLAMSAAQDDKNRIQEQLRSLGLSDATLRLIRQGKWV